MGLTSFNTVAEVRRVPAPFYIERVDTGGTGRPLLHHCMLEVPMPNRLHLLACAALLSVACSKDDTPPADQAASPPPAAGTPAVTAVDTTGMTRLPSGLMYKDLAPGSGEAAHSGQTVGVHYVGTLMDGREFDANRAGEPPMEFQLGAHRMIDGFDQAVTGMKVGGKRMVVMPPALAYGANGNGPIPPNATIAFTIDLVTVR